MTGKYFTLEITECAECPYWDHFVDACDYEGDQMEVVQSNAGELPDNCPIWLERMEDIKAHPKTIAESFSTNPDKGVKNILRWQK